MQGRTANGPDSWPSWYALLGFGTAVAATLLANALVRAAYLQVGGDVGQLPPSLIILRTLAQALVLIGTVGLFARAVKARDPSDFGLRPTPFLPALVWVAAGALSFYLLAALYARAAAPFGGAEFSKVLGISRKPVHAVGAAIVVILVASLAEELFFRGFLYRAIRNRLSTYATVAIVAAMFGSLHYGGSGTLVLIPVAALLGALLCLVYERTQSLYPGIALHAVSNSVAVAATVKGPSIAIAAALATVAVSACLFGPAWQLRIARGTCR